MELDSLMELAQNLTIVRHEVRLTEVGRDLAEIQRWHWYQVQNTKPSEVIFTENRMLQDKKRVLQELRDRVQRWFHLFAVLFILCCWVCLLLVLVTSFSSIFMARHPEVGDMAILAFFTGLVCGSCALWCLIKRSSYCIPNAKTYSWLLAEIALATEVKDRTHSCPECKAPNQFADEACPQCGLVVSAKTRATWIQQAGL